MKLISEVLQPCGCLDRIAAFETMRADRNHPRLHLGSIVECDCGRQFRLRDDQREGMHWNEFPAKPLATSTAPTYNLVTEP